MLVNVSECKGVIVSVSLFVLSTAHLKRLSGLPYAFIFLYIANKCDRFAGGNNIPTISRSSSTTNIPVA